MKIVIAPDKFKNSLTGLEFCAIVEKGIKNAMPNAKILKLPMADGGDGTMEAVQYYLEGKKVTIEVQNPLFETITASYLYSEKHQTAYIEMAEASGLKTLNFSPQVMASSTYGTGELIADALQKGVKKIILGIGGSATNDCGIGMANALGFRFLDVNNKEVKPISQNVINITEIDSSQKHPQLNQVEFEVACDVKNPLYGKKGAAYIYGAQKGATAKEIELLDQGLKHFANLVKQQQNIDLQQIAGAGAAGGMGGGATIFLNAQLIPGIDLIKSLAQFDQKITDADWIITGEGSLDQQTLSGKTIQGVLQSAYKANIPVAAFCGKIELSKSIQKSNGIYYVSAIMDLTRHLSDAMENAPIYLNQITQQFCNRILKEE